MVDTDEVDDDVALPASELAVKARLRGLLGDARKREIGFDDVVLGRAERRESFRPERSGVEKKPGCAFVDGGAVAEREEDIDRSQSFEKDELEREFERDGVWVGVAVIVL